MVKNDVRHGVCNLCEAICGLRIALEDERIVSITGNDRDPLSEGHLCPKGVALQDLQDDPDRLRRPMRRRGDEWEAIGWPEAIDHTARRLAEVRKTHGADAVASYLGNPVVHSLGAMTHGMPFVRLLGSRNRFSATSVDQLPHQLVAAQMYGHQWLLPVPDLPRTQHLLIVGSNPVASNGSLMTAPGFPGHLRRLRERGGRVVVLDPRRTETAAIADEHHFIRPGTDAAALLAMIHTILDEDLGNPASYVDGLGVLAATVEPFTPEAVSASTGLDPRVTRRLAREFANAPAAACHGRMGASTQRYGALAQWAIQLLNVLTGNLDRPGGTLFSTPAIDPIGLRTIDPGHQGRWRSRVRELPEFGGELPVAILSEEILTPGPGQVRALVTVAGNPVSSTPAGHRLSDALEHLDFFVAIDLYINETTRHADLILPPTTILERDHYDLVYHPLGIRNTARYVPPVLPKPPDARHDWEILAQVARRYRRHVRAGKLSDRLTLRMKPSTIVDLGLRMGPHRLTLRKLRRDPDGIDLGPLEPRLPDRLRTPGQIVRATPPPLVEAAAGARSALLAPPTPGTLHLIGRRHLRDNNSWMHNLTRLTRGRPRHQLLMHPTDLERRGIRDGDRVAVTSRVGRIEVEVAATTDLMPGVASLPHGYGHAQPGVQMREAKRLPGASMNDLTDPAELDELGGTAVLNGVEIEVAPLGPDHRPHASRANRSVAEGAEPGPT